MRPPLGCRPPRAHATTGPAADRYDPPRRAELDSSHWVPMRWPCGPLEIERGKRARGSPREAETLTEWCDPEALERLAGCSGELPRGHLGEGVGGRRGPPASARSPDRRRAAAAGSRSSAGCRDGRRREARRRHRPGRGPRRDRHRVRASPLPAPRSSASATRSLARSLARRRFSASSAPSGPAFGRRHRAGPTPRPAPRARPGWTPTPGTFASPACLVSPKTLWLAFDPPDLGQPVAAAAYVQAIADTEVCGGRWVVSLDPHLRARPLGTARRGPRDLGRGSAAASPSSRSTAPGRATARSDSSGSSPTMPGPTSSCRSRC